MKALQVDFHKAWILCFAHNEVTLMSTTRDWITKQLAGHEEVVTVEPKGELFINIQRKTYAPFTSAILNKDRVNRSAIESVFDHGDQVQFVANVPQDGVWMGEAIEIARARNVGWGGFGDLMRAINSDSVEGFQKKEYSFAERGIRQHDRVECYKRIFDRVFLLFRKGLPELKVALVYEYELTAEHVRAARDKYGDFSVIVKTNPNGNITGSAQEVGKGLGVDILKWGEFLGRINRP